MELQTKVILPSNGKLYKTKEVTIKPMTSADFDLINDSSDVEFIYKVIQNNIVEPKGLSVYDLHPFDIDAILFALRNLSIGPTYEQNVVCPFCRTQQTLMVDMDTWETEVLDEVPPTQVAMPNGDIVNLNILTEKIQRQAREDAKGNQVKLPYYLLVNLIKSIKLKEPINPHPNVTIEEYKTLIEIEEWVAELTYKDRLYLQQAIQPLKFGVDTSMQAICENENCKQKFRVIGAIDGVTAPEFFRPTLFKK